MFSLLRSITIIALDYWTPLLLLLLVVLFIVREPPARRSIRLKSIQTSDGDMFNLGPEARLAGGFELRVPVMVLALLLLVLLLLGPQ